MTDAVVVLCTAPNEAVAQELAKGLLEARLVACVTLFAGARSFYRWKGRVEEASEQQLLIKTQRAQSDAALAWLRTHHPSREARGLAQSEDLLIMTQRIM
ncbi:MAG: divalent-cation tolerance protein CutA, partial [Myxococcota bacterium]